MNGKQAKRARLSAYGEAQRQGLWKQGEAGVYAKWWRKLLARVFPRLRKRYADWVGRWYRKTLKTWARQAAEYIHDRDAQAFARAQARSRRKFARDRMKRQLASAAERIATEGR